MRRVGTDGAARRGVATLRNVAFGVLCAGVALACAPAQTDPAGVVASSHEALGALVAQTAGRSWYTQHVKKACDDPFVPSDHSVDPGAGSATFALPDGGTVGTFTLQSDHSWGIKNANYASGPYRDNLQFVYTQLDSVSDQNIELVVHVTDVHGDAEPRGQVGLMLRDADEQNPCTTDGGSAGTLNNSYALMASVFYEYGATAAEPRPACQSTNPLMSAFTHVVRTNYLAPAVKDGRPLPTGDPVSTWLAPPNVYLRLQRLGKDYSVAHSDDGRTWTTMHGGDFQPVSSSPLLGFYVAGEPLGAGLTQTVTASVVVDYIGPPRLDVQTSWIGSSFVATSTDYVSRGMQGFYVDPQGTGYKYTYEQLEGVGPSHPFNKFSNAGALLGIPAGNMSGVPGLLQGGITGDGTNIYFARVSCPNPTDYCVEKRRPTDMQVLGTTGPLGRIGGIAARGGKLYVSQFDAGTVRVFDTTQPDTTPPSATLSELPGLQFTTPSRPGALAVDSANAVWVAQNRAGYAQCLGGHPACTPTDDPSVAAVKNFLPDLTFGTCGTDAACKSSVYRCTLVTGKNSCTGAFQHQWSGNFTALAVAPAFGQFNERLLIADNGPDQDIRTCENLATAPTCTTTFGTPAGVFSDPHPGDVGGSSTPRFFSPVGVGTGDSGSIYVASASPRVQVDKFASTDASTPAWSRYGLGQDPGAFDPDTDGTDYFTLTRHYTFNPNAVTTPGQPAAQWSPKGVTLNPFRSVKQPIPPTNPRTYVISEDWHRFLPTHTNDAPIIQRIGGQRFMFIESIEGTGWKLRVFRFQDEVAIPCARFQFVPSTQDASKWALEIWIDAGALNGEVDTSPTSELTTLSTLLVSAPPAQAVDVAADGSVWIALPKGANATERVWQLPATLQNGFPHYSTKQAYTIPSEQPFDNDNPTYVRFDTAAPGSLYLFGGLRLTMMPGHQSETATCTSNRAFAFMRYDLSGTTLVPHTGYPTSLPQITFGPDTPHGPGDPPVPPSTYDKANCSCSSIGDYYGFDIAGDMIFAQSSLLDVHVLRKETGQPVTRFVAGPEVSGYQNLSLFSLGPLRAFKRANGEYLITTGDLTGQARTLLFRWTPPAWSPTELAPLAWYAAAPSSVTLVNGTVSVWKDQSGNAHDVVQGSTGYRPDYQPTGLGGHPALSFNGTTAFLRDNGWTLGAPNGNEAEFTVLAVVQPTAVQEGGIASWYATLGGGWVSTRLVPSGPNLVGQIRRQGVNQDNYTFPGTTPVDSLQAHVVAYRFKAGSLSITVDATKEPEGTVHQALSTVMNTEFLVGREDTLFARDYAGRLSELIVVGRELTDSEVASYRAYAHLTWGTQQ